ncbi:MAG: COX15/CtaA family protein [Dehalococcoidia bacterium]
MERALRLSIRHERAGGALRVLTLASAVALFGLIILGGVVRVTESGLGCPDWPFCHGQIIPPADTATLIEYSHRLLATVTGLMVFATAAVVWVAYRAERWLMGPMTLAVALLVAQVLLGGATVRTELAPGLVMAHLAVAQVLLACMIVAGVVAWRGTSPVRQAEGGIAARAPRSTLMPVALVGTFVLLLAGSYVQASEATGACGDSWPLCQGELLPGGELPLVHMLHRFLAILVGVLVLAYLMEVWRTRRQPWLRMVALAIVGLFVGQVIVGGFNVWLAFPRSVNVLHLAMGTGVWAVLVLLVALGNLLPASETEGSDGT